jgi:hypothetical protein
MWKIQRKLEETNLKLDLLGREPEEPSAVERRAASEVEKRLAHYVKTYEDFHANFLLHQVKAPFVVGTRTKAHQMDQDLKEFLKRDSSIPADVRDAIQTAQVEPMFATESTDVFGGDEEALPALQCTPGEDLQYVCCRTGQPKTIRVPSSCAEYIVASEKLDDFIEAMLKRVIDKLEEGVKLLKPVFLREIRKLLEAEYKVQLNALHGGMTIIASLTLPATRAFRAPRVGGRKKAARPEPRKPGGPTGGFGGGGGMGGGGPFGGAASTPAAPTPASNAFFGGAFGAAAAASPFGAAAAASPFGAAGAASPFGAAASGAAGAASPFGAAAAASPFGAAAAASPFGAAAAASGAAGAAAAAAAAAFGAPAGASPFGASSMFGAAAPAFGASSTSAAFGASPEEIVDDIVSEIVDEVASAEVEDERHFSSSWFEKSRDAFLLHAFGGVMTRDQLVAKARSEPPFMLSKHDGYINKILDACGDAFDECTVNLRKRLILSDETDAQDRLGRLLEQFFYCCTPILPDNPENKRHFDLYGPTIRVKVLVEEMSDSFVTEFIKCVPPPKRIRNIHEGVSPGSESAWVGKRRAELKAEIAKIERARDGLSEAFNIINANVEGGFGGGGGAFGQKPVGGGAFGAPAAASPFGAPAASPTAFGAQAGASPFGAPQQQQQQQQQHQYGAPASPFGGGGAQRPQGSVCRFGVSYRNQHICSTYGNTSHKGINCSMLPGAGAYRVTRVTVGGGLPQLEAGRSLKAPGFNT